MLDLGWCKSDLDWAAALYDSLFVINYLSYMDIPAEITASVRRKCAPPLRSTMALA
jgi:hypothetical protein